MLCQHYQRRRRDDGYGVHIEGRRGKLRNGKPGRIDHRGHIHHTQEKGQDIAADHPEQDGDNCHKALEGNRTDDGDQQRKYRDHHIVHFNFIPYKPGHGSSRRRQFQPYDGNNGPHSGRRENKVDPFRAHHLYNEREQDEQQTEYNETGLGV